MLYTGAKIDKQDKRDKEIDHILGVGEPFDWIKGYDVEEEIGMTIPVKDQKKTSSCVGQATASLVWIKNVREYLDRYGKLTDEMKDYLNKWLISARAIYSQIFLLHGGAYLRDGVKLIKEWGSISENIVPFVPDENGCRSLKWKTKMADETAKILQAEEYRMLRAKTIDLMAQSIRDNEGVILGVLGENNGTWHSLMPRVGKDEWGHAILGGKARMINGKKYIGILNSWGEKIGDNGWQWLGEEWFEQGQVFNPWMLVDKKNKGWIWLIDRDGKPRKMMAYLLKTITYLLSKRGFKLQYGKKS